MSLTTVAELRSALGIGTLYADAVLQSVCDAADNVMLPFLWTNTYPTVAHSNVGTVGRLYFGQPVEDIFYVGQTLIISGSGIKYNGTKVIQNIENDYIEITTTHTNDSTIHPIYPYGSAAGTVYTDFATIPAIQEASLMISVAIWQARQAPTGQGVSIDGYAPSPYTMSNQLMARVRGLLAPYLSPNSMVG